MLNLKDRSRYNWKFDFFFFVKPFSAFLLLLVMGVAGATYKQLVEDVDFPTEIDLDERYFQNIDPPKKTISNPTPGTFGDDFKDHFADTEDAENDSWWKESYKYRWKDDDSGTDFSELVTVGARKNEGKDSYEFLTAKSPEALKNACKKAYEKKTQDYIYSDTDVDKQLYSHIVWRYCSVEGDVPVILLEDEPGDELEDVKHEDFKLVLISTTSTFNMEFWEIQAKAFFKTDDGKDGLGRGAKEESAGFKQIYEGSDKSAQTLKSKCQENYKQNLTKQEKASVKKEVLMFCSLQGKQSASSTKKSNK